MRPVRRLAFAATATVCLVASVVVATPGSAAVAASAGSVDITKIATGMTLTEISDPSGPYEIRILTIDPTTALTIDTVMPNKTLPGVLQPSEMGDANGALAAINGDFTTTPGRPVHPFAMDGYLEQSGFQAGTSFAIREDETAAYVDTPSPSVRVRDHKTGNFQLSAWNMGEPAAGEIAGYSAAGSGVSETPASACSVRLKSLGKLTWTSDEAGIAKDYKVAVKKCQPKAMALKGGVVLATPRSSDATASLIKAMKPGHVVTLTWSMAGMPGITDSIGSSPTLVEDGQNVGPCCGNRPFFDLNPRTGIGFAADGTVFFVVVDGRDANWSIGMHLDEFAQVFIDLGATYAINLDGGGSTAMWVKGMGLVNRPSDPEGERPVSNGVLVLPGADEHAKVPARPSFAPSVSWADVWARMSSDPGSIGGLADAAVAGQLPGESPTNPPFMTIARLFSSALRAGS
jgi:exopolysaccharide biosynthesis protein